VNRYLMACYVKHIFTKNYQSLIIGFQVTVENVGDTFLRHSVVHNYPAVKKAHHCR